MENAASTESTAEEMNTEEIIAEEPSEEEVSEEKGSEEETSKESVNMENADFEEYLAEHETLKRGDLGIGVVVEENDQGLVVDIGLKQEGLVPKRDLNRLEEETLSEIEPGAEVPVLVVHTRDNEGRPQLSIHQAILQEDWQRAEEMMEEGNIFEGEVSGYNRGGLVVQFGKIRGFVPASHTVGLPRGLSEAERRRRLEAMVGRKIGVKVIEVERRRRRLILSERRARREWQKKQRDRLMDELNVGETRHGRVTGITDFGAFVDLGGADGLIHISELSWGRVKNPREVVRTGEEVDVYVLDVDRDRQRIALSLKKLQPDPWSLIEDHYDIGELVEGRVTRVLDFGAFVQLEPGVEGLLHVSEMIGTPELKPSEIVSAGDTILVKVIRIEPNRRRIALSAKRVHQDEWERWAAEKQAEESEAEPEPQAEPETEPEDEEEEPIELEVEVEEAEVEPEGASEMDEPSEESEVEQGEAKAEESE